MKLERHRVAPEKPVPHRSDLFISCGLSSGGSNEQKTPKRISNI